MGVAPALARLRGESDEQEAAEIREAEAEAASAVDAASIQEKWRERGIDGTRLLLIDITLQPDTSHADGQSAADRATG